MSGKKSGIKTQNPSSPNKNKSPKCRGGCAHGPQSPQKATATVTVVSPEVHTLPAVQNDNTNTDDPLVQENIELKNQQKELEVKIQELESQQDKARLLNTRLENLCTELQNRTKQLKEESETKIHEAETRGKELAKEVVGNLGAMENINENLQQITQDSLQSRKYNENLAQQIPQMKVEYNQKEEETTTKIQETNDKIVNAKMEVAQTKLANALDKEKTFAELKTLATAIIESREQMKVIKETELMLRQHIANYDEKFVALQGALQETNKAYEGFKGEMEKITIQTKSLEADAIKWQKRWESSNAELQLLEQSHDKLQAELQRTNGNLIKMTDLYTALKKDQNVVNMEASVVAADKLFQIQNKSGPGPSQSIPPENQPKELPLDANKVPLDVTVKAGATEDQPQPPSSQAQQKTPPDQTNKNKKKRNKGKK